MDRLCSNDFIGQESYLESDLGVGIFGQQNGHTGTEGAIGQTAIFKCKHGYYNQKYPLRNHEVAICSPTEQKGNGAEQKWIGIDGKGAVHGNR